MFTLPPNETELFIKFLDDEHKLDKLYAWGLISETARNKHTNKNFEYSGMGLEAACPCEIVGYIPYNEEQAAPDTAVIMVDGQLHKIMPAYLKEMQKGSVKLPEETQVKRKTKTVKAAKTSLFKKQEGQFDFVAIDFETANAELNSACSIGIVAVNNNEIVEKKYWLIKPSVVRFDAKNTEIHGLTAENVVDAADFSGVWPEIAPYITDNIIVAHNAAFDMSVLKCCLEEYNIAVPDTGYVCSIAVSDYAFPAKTVKSLAERTRLLGIEIENAHNALADAVACAELVIRTLKINAEASLQEFIAGKRSLRSKPLTALKQMTSFHKPQNHKQSRFKQISIAEIAATVDKIDTQNPVYGKAFVFTGEMEQMEREEAMQMVVNLGGVIKSGVSKKVNYLVVGVQDKSLVGSSGMSSKEVKAQELIEQGIDIQVICEKAFMELIGYNHGQ
jgi:DNA polymerase-3 subunit epsilon